MPVTSNICFEYWRLWYKSDEDGVLSMMRAARGGGRVVGFLICMLIPTGYLLDYVCMYTWEKERETESGKMLIKCTM